MPAVVADATPIIHLERIGRLDLLAQVFTTIRIPPMWPRKSPPGMGTPGNRLRGW